MFHLHEDRVWGREGTDKEHTAGVVVGIKRCTLSGCSGERVGVRWPSGKLTWPCTKGMTQIGPGEWRIE